MKNIFVIFFMTFFSCTIVYGETIGVKVPNDKEYYEYMKSYSPYDNLKNVEYPNTLVTTGLHDSQVQYWEPAKWVAKLRQYHKGENLILLHTNMDTGHSGSSGRFEALKEVAMEYAFLFMLENIDD